SANVHTEHHELLNELYSKNLPGNWHYFDKDTLPSYSKETSGGRPQPQEEDVALLFPQFYISENGSLVLASFDPYVDSLLATCKKLILVLGIEQLCPGMNEADNLLSLMVRAGYGKKDFSSLHFIHGNRALKEQSGQLET